MQASSCRVTQHTESSAVCTQCFYSISPSCARAPASSASLGRGQRGRIHFPMQRKAGWCTNLCGKPFCSSVRRPLSKGQLQHYPFEGVFKAVHPLSFTHLLHPPMKCKVLHLSPPIVLPFLLLMTVYEEKTLNHPTEKNSQTKLFILFHEGNLKILHMSVSAPISTSNHYQSSIYTPQETNLPPPKNKEKDAAILLQISF